MRIGEVANTERGAWGTPLEGIRILAVEQMQALPYATRLLSHLGAEVVKIEPPGRGETGRASQPSLEDEDGRRVGATYLRNNLNKKSITLDLKSEFEDDPTRPRYDSGVGRRLATNIALAAAVAAGASATVLFFYTDLGGKRGERDETATIGVGLRGSF